MLNISTQLKDAIITGKVCRYVLITFTDGSTAAITNHDRSFTLDADEYVPSPNLSAIQMLQTSGTQVSTQKVFSTWFEGIFNPEDLEAGLYDDADIQVGWIGWDMSPLERMVIFSGKVGEISYNDEGLSIEALDDQKLLEENFGRTYTTHDPYTFGDAQFGLSEATYTEGGTIDFVLSNRLKFKASGAMTGQDAGWFTFGKLTFLTGPNTGWSGEVKIHAKDGDVNIGTSIEFYIPTPFPMTVGDTFDVVAGYDGSFEQSKNKFNNGINFGGFPHVEALGEQ